ncbi:hypothetical protein VNO77_21861 [Canavalia gladiata]|uniref:Uncharacterized protein n=1 Tax=Canavalia gladiata TaxID=3824 RepID=A0AAN9Q7I5_CANGL
MTLYITVACYAFPHKKGRLLRIGLNYIWAHTTESSFIVVAYRLYHFVKSLILPWCSCIMVPSVPMIHSSIQLTEITGFFFGRLYRNHGIVDILSKDFIM